MGAKRKRGGRRDAVRIRNQHYLNKLFPYLMKRRCDSLVYYSLQLDMEPLLAYIARRKEAGQAISFFEFFCAATIKLLFDREEINRFIKGRRLYQREFVEIATVAKRAMTDQGAETNLIFDFKKGVTFDEIVGKLRGEIKIVKENAPSKDDKLFATFLKFPRSLLMTFFKFLDLSDFYRGVPRFISNADPMRASCFIANLGSVGIEAPFHHLYEWGTCSLFVTIGRIKKMPVVLQDDTLGVRTMVECKAVLDERIADGFYFARSMDLFTNYFAEPEKMIESMQAPL